jgi:hypothetical protein
MFSLVVPVAAGFAGHDPTIHDQPVVRDVTIHYQQTRSQPLAVGLIACGETKK